MKANDRQVGGAHYHSEIQHWDFVLANDIPYMEAQIIKYVYRWRKKGGIQDLKKAQHFLEKLIEWNATPAELSDIERLDRPHVAVGVRHEEA